MPTFELGDIVIAVSGRYMNCHGVVVGLLGSLVQVKTAKGLEFVASRTIVRRYPN